MLILDFKLIFYPLKGNKLILIALVMESGRKEHKVNKVVPYHIIFS